MNTIMTFDALRTVTDTVAEAIIDAIKVSVARTSDEKAQAEGGAQHSIVNVKITRTEVLWYFKNLFASNRKNKVDEDKLLAKVFNALPENRIVHFKSGVYAMSGVTLNENNKVIGVMLTAHDNKVKPVPHAEPTPKV